MDADTLKLIVRGLLSQDHQTQADTVKRYFHPDVSFYHWAVRTYTADEYLKCFQLFTRINDSVPDFQEIIISEDKTKALVWVNQLIVSRPVPWTWFKRAVIPTLAIFTFDTMPDGRVVIKDHFDHFSIYCFVWCWGTIGLLLFERLWQPFNRWGSLRAAEAFNAANWVRSSLFGQRQQHTATTASAAVSNGNGHSHAPLKLS